MALGHEELAEVITAWPLLSADLRQAILAIVRSATLITEASLAASEAVDTLRGNWSRLREAVSYTHLTLPTILLV